MKLRTLTLGICALWGATACSSTEPTTTANSQERGASALSNNNNYVDQSSNLRVDFKAFKTYAWASQVSDDKNNAFFLNDAAYKNNVREAVKHEMEARGYVYQATDPDLLVNFRVFEQPTEIRDRAGYGTDYWTANEYRTDNRPSVIKLDRGSIVMQLVDRKKSEVVWQGYASGLNQNEAMSKEQATIASAVNKVFAQYSYRADQ